MSSPRYWWYGIIVRMIRAYPELTAREDLSPAEDRALDAVAAALMICTLEERAVVRLNIWQGLTLDQAAAQLHMSEKTAYNRRRAFVYRVARAYGYLEQED